MIDRTTVSTGGDAYVDIRIGEGHTVHEGLLDATNLAASRDADGMLPVGLPITAAGQLVTVGVAVYGIIGPEPVKLGTVNKFGNMIMQGVLNRDAMERNLGRVLSADEVTQIGVGTKAITLR